MLKRKTKFNEFGEIIQPDEKLGRGYFRKNGKEFYDLEGPEGDIKRIKLSNDYQGYTFNKLLEYANSKKHLGLGPIQAKEIIFRKAKIPFRKKVRKTYEYSAVKVDVGNNTEMIIIDSRLDRPAQIASLYHEIVHARGYDFPPGKSPTEAEMEEIDKKTHLETIRGLREMTKIMPKVYEDASEGKIHGLGESDFYPFLDKNEDYSPRVLREAINYAIASRGSFGVSSTEIRNRIRKQRTKESGLEKAVETAFFVILPIVFVYIILNIKFTGSVIGNSAVAGVLGIVFFFLSIAFLYFKLKRK